MMDSQEDMTDEELERLVLEAQDCVLSALEVCGIPGDDLLSLAFVCLSARFAVLRGLTDEEYRTECKAALKDARIDYCCEQCGTLLRFYEGAGSAPTLLCPECDHEHAAELTPC